MKGQNQETYVGAKFAILLYENPSRHMIKVLNNSAVVLWLSD